MDLGIEAPEDIDVEAIAWAAGASVRYRRLADCEARIVGLGGRAIITVDDRVYPRRQRFSVAHELGHWRHHRDRCLICRADQIGNGRRSALDPERIADDYASDLLLPRYLLEPMLRTVTKPTLRAIRGIADAFDASLTSTLIKVAECDRYPMIVVCSGRDGRRWFRASPSVPRRLFPKDKLDVESCAYDVLVGSAELVFPRRTDGDTWFDGHGMEDVALLEQAYAVPGEQVVTVLQVLDT